MRSESPAEPVDLSARPPGPRRPLAAWLGGTAVLAAVAVGCTVPALDADSGAAETDVVDEDTAPTGETAVDTDETDLEPEDTDDTDLDSTTGPDPDDLPPMPCHPFDPVASPAGWTRTYTVSYGPRSGGTERQTGNGPDAIPPGWAGSETQGWSYDVAISGAGSANSTGVTYVRCGIGGPADESVYEIGFTKTASGSTLKAGARAPRKYLPDEREMYGTLPPYFEVDMRYKLTLPSIGLPTPDYNLVHEGSVTGFGWVTENIPPLGGPVDAYKLVVIYEEYQEEVGGGGGFSGFFERLFAPFFPLFESLFGIQQGAESVSAQSELLYVRGVGLVYERTISTTDGSLIREKRLTGCNGLPHASCGGTP